MHCWSGLLTRAATGAAPFSCFAGQDSDLDGVRLDPSTLDASEQDRVEGVGVWVQSVDCELLLLFVFLLVVSCRECSGITCYDRCLIIF